MMCLRLGGNTQTKYITSELHVGAHLRKTFGPFCNRRPAQQACTLQPWKECAQTTRIHNAHHERTACRDEEAVAILATLAAVHKVTFTFVDVFSVEIPQGRLVVSWNIRCANVTKQPKRHPDCFLGSCA